MSKSELFSSNERSPWFIVLYEWQGCQQMTTDAAWWPSAEIMGAEAGALATIESLHRGEQPRRGQLTCRNIRGPFPWAEQPASASASETTCKHGVLLSIQDSCNDCENDAKESAQKTTLPQEKP